MDIPVTTYPSPGMILQVGGSLFAMETHDGKCQVTIQLATGLAPQYHHLIIGTGKKFLQKSGGKA